MGFMDLQKEQKVSMTHLVQLMHLQQCRLD